MSKCADSFVHQSGAPTVTVTGLDHLETETVVAWGDGRDLGEYVVAGGQITLDSPCSEVVAGLPYTARYMSTKLKELDIAKRVTHITMVLANTHMNGVRYGADFDNLDDLPGIEEGTAVDPDFVWDAYHDDPVEFNGTYGPDSRVCIEAAAPRPATVLAFVVEYTP